MRRSNAVLMLICISSFFMLLSFQNCSKGFKAPDAASFASRGPASIVTSEMGSGGALDRLLTVQSVPGATYQTANPMDGLGVASEDPGYNPYGALNQKFLAGAEDALALNFKTFKVYMGRAVKTVPSFYNIPANEMANVNTMKDAADSPSFKKLFSMGFKTFFVEAVAFDLKDRHVMWYPLDSSVPGFSGAPTNLANDPFTPFDLNREYREVYDLAAYFLQTYKGSGKTFVLQNHEGDHHTFDWNNTSGYDKMEPNPVGLANLKKYWEVRQQAVNDAKASFPSDVKVYHMCEVVRVRRSLEYNLASLTRDVLPQVNCDLVGYSAHESAIENGPALFESALSYIAQHAQPSKDFGHNNVIISEIGTLENDPTYSQRADQVAQIVAGKLKAGMPYVLYWSLYDNGCVSGSCSGELKNSDVVGMWIRKPDGSFGEVYKKIISLLTQKEPNTFVALPSITSMFRLTLGREPSAEEGLSATHRFEMGTATLAQIQSEVTAKRRDQDVAKIRELSLKYFGKQSQDNAAVEKQLGYLAGGATYSQLEAKFALVKSSWIAESGSVPPEYFWVDRGMNYLIDGGTEAQYRAEIKKVLVPAVTPPVTTPPVTTPPVTTPPVTTPPVVTPPVTTPPVTTPPVTAPVDPAVLRAQRLAKINSLSQQYFAAQSGNSAAIEKQISFLAAGNSDAALGNLFSRVKANWISETGSAPPAYSWVDSGMNYLIDGGTDAQYRAEIQKVWPGMLRDQRVIKIRALSVQYFGQQSQDTAAVEKQISFLAAGNGEAALGNLFSRVKADWIAETGSAPPEYLWVDRGMNYLIDGGTDAQYRAEIQKVWAGLLRDQRITKIRALSVQYFGRQSQDNAAVEKQVAYLAAGGTEAGLAAMFAATLQAWTSVYGAPPPDYSWVDTAMNFRLNGATEAQYLSEVKKTVAKTWPLQGIRTLSMKYFSAISTDSDAVGRQQSFLLGSGTLDQLEGYFAAAKRAWIAETGSPPPAYFWVDRAVNYQLNGGTEDQYRNEIRKLNGNY